MGDGIPLPMRLASFYCWGGVEVPLPEFDPFVPVPVDDEPALLEPLVPLLDDPARFEPLVPLLEEPAVFEPLVPLLEEPAELAPLLRLRLVSLELVPLLLLGRVVGSLLDAPLLELPLVSRLRGVVELVPVSLLSQPMKAMPPNASATETRIA